MMLRSGMVGSGLALWVVVVRVVELLRCVGGADGGISRGALYQTWVIDVACYYSSSLDKLVS